MSGAACLAGSVAGAAPIGKDPVSSRVTKVTTVFSAAGMEAQLQTRFIDEFLELLIVDLAGCEGLVKALAGSAHAQALLRLPLKWASSTLRRHLSGWRRWSSFARTSGWDAGQPSCSQFCDFLYVLVEAADEDRLPAAFGSIASVVSAVRFICDKFEVLGFAKLARSPAVCGFLNCMPATIKREAPPFSRLLWRPWKELSRVGPWGILKSSLWASSSCSCGPRSASVMASGHPHAALLLKAL